MCVCGGKLEGGGEGAEDVPVQKRGGVSAVRWLVGGWVFHGMRLSGVADSGEEDGWPLEDEGEGAKDSDSGGRILWNERSA